MQCMKKGEKVSCNGFFLTDKEYYNYKKLLGCVQVFKSCKRDYDRVYKSYLM